MTKNIDELHKNYELVVWDKSGKYVLDKNPISSLQGIGYDIEQLEDGRLVVVDENDYGSALDMDINWKHIKTEDGQLIDGIEGVFDSAKDCANFLEDFYTDTFLNHGYHHDVLGEIGVYRIAALKGAYEVDQAYIKEQVDALKIQFEAEDVAPLYTADVNIFFEIKNKAKKDYILDAHDNSYNDVIAIDREDYSMNEMSTEQTSGFKTLAAIDERNFNVEGILKAHNQTKMSDYTNELVNYQESLDEFGFHNKEFMGVNDPNGLIRLFSIGLNSGWSEITEGAYVPVEEVNVVQKRREQSDMEL